MIPVASAIAAVIRSKVAQAGNLPWMLLWMLLLPSDATVRHLLLLTMIPPLEQSLLSSVTH